MTSIWGLYLGPVSEWQPLKEPLNKYPTRLPPEARAGAQRPIVIFAGWSGNCAEPRDQSAGHRAFPREGLAMWEKPASARLRVKMGCGLFLMGNS
jgi:hypothetical protein